MECASLSGGDWGEWVAQERGREVMVGAQELALTGALPSARGGTGLCMRREAAMAALPFVHHSTMVLCCYGSLHFLHKHSWLQSSSLPAPQAVSSHPTAVPSLGLLSKPHIPAPSPCAHQWTPVSGWGVQGCGTGHLCKFHFVLGSQLLGSPLSL